MRPSPSIEPFTPSPDISLPHPVLRAALDNLDVKLEEELVRYRRQRRLQSDKVQSNSYQSKFQIDSAQSRSFTVGGAALGSRPIARRAQTGIDLPNFKDFNPDGEFPIGNSSDSENPVKSILGSTIASQRAASRFATAPSLRMPSVEVPPFAPSEATPSAPAYQPKAYHPAYQPRAYQQPAPREEDFTASPLLPEEPSFSPAIGTDAIGITSYAQQPELSAYAPSATLQKFVQEQREHYPPDPDGYLESSEELLKSIEEEAPFRVRRRADLLDLLLTPLGVGSMLLLLLSSATLGFLIMNPGTLSALFSPDADLAANPASPNPSSPISGPLMRVPTTPINSAPPSPDLSAEEFRDVNLNTLSTLPSGSSAAAQRSARSSDRPVAQSAPAPTQTGAPAPTQSGGSGNAAPAIVPQSDLPSVPVQSQPVQPQPAQSAPPYTPPAYTQPPYSPPAYSPPVYTQPSYNPSASPASSPSPTGSPLPVQASPSASRPIDVPPPDSSDIAALPSSSPATTQPAASQDYYYVGTNYSGDSSLQQARQTVPDAYVRNLPSGGAIVQAGAFSSESAAEERVQELQQQGFPAQIYHP